MLGMGGWERNRVNCPTNRGVWASTLALILEANMLYSQHPFGWNKEEPSQLASKVKQHQETPGFFLIACGRAGLGFARENL